MSLKDNAMSYEPQVCWMGRFGPVSGGVEAGLGALSRTRSMDTSFGLTQPRTSAICAGSESSDSNSNSAVSTCAVHLCVKSFESLPAALSSALACFG